MSFKEKKKRQRKRKKKNRYHRGTHTSPIAGECKFRSSWEQKYMEYLDSNLEVLSWSYEKLSIEYISNKKTKKVRKYYPDFQIEYKDGRKVIVEIKPSRKLQQATVVKKIRAAKEWCTAHDVVYKVLTEIELKDIGLL
jgi:hypothetical protein